MIILPTRRKLIRRRDALYSHLQSILHLATVYQVEDIMRKIHCINFKLKIYFNSDEEFDTYEPAEIFDTEDIFEKESEGKEQIDQNL